MFVICCVNNLSIEIIVYKCEIIFLNIMSCVRMNKRFDISFRYHLEIVILMVAAWKWIVCEWIFSGKRENKRIRWNPVSKFNYLYDNNKTRNVSIKLFIIFEILKFCNNFWIWIFEFRMFVVRHDVWCEKLSTTTTRSLYWTKQYNIFTTTPRRRVNECVYL